MHTHTSKPYRMSQFKDKCTHTKASCYVSLTLHRQMHAHKSLRLYNVSRFLDTCTHTNALHYTTSRALKTNALAYKLCTIECLMLCFIACTRKPCTIRGPALHRPMDTPESLPPYNASHSKDKYTHTKALCFKRKMHTHKSFVLQTPMHTHISLMLQTQIHTRKPHAIECLMLQTKARAQTTRAV